MVHQLFSTKPNKIVNVMRQSHRQKNTPFYTWEIQLVEFIFISRKIVWSKKLGGFGLGIFVNFQLIKFGKFTASANGPLTLPDALNLSYDSQIFLYSYNMAVVKEANRILGCILLCRWLTGREREQILGTTES